MMKIYYKLGLFFICATLLSGCGGFVGKFVGWDGLTPEEASNLKGATLTPVRYPLYKFTQDASYASSMMCMNGICTPVTHTRIIDLTDVAKHFKVEKPADLISAGLMKTLTNQFGAKEVSSSVVVPEKDGTRIAPTKLLTLYPESDYLLDIAMQDWQIRYDYFHFNSSMRLIQRRNAEVISSWDCQIKTNRSFRDFDQENTAKIVAYVLLDSPKRCASGIINDWLNTAKGIPLPADKTSK